MAIEATTGAHTLWSDRTLEDEVLQAISLDLPWSVVERFAGLTRLSGSSDEAEAIDLIQGHLAELGIPHTLHKPVTYISIPLEATVRALGGEGRSFRAKTSAMSVSTNGEELEGELLYVGAATSDTPGDVISATVDMSGVDGTGEDHRHRGVALPGHRRRGDQIGSGGGNLRRPRQEHPRDDLHPDLGIARPGPIDRRPTLRSSRSTGSMGIAGRAGADGSAGGGFDASRYRLARDSGPGRGDSRPDRSRTNSSCLHGHLDSWHVGIGDNATGDATMLELARVFWQFRDQLKRSLRIAWWSGHTHGRYAGSTWYADTFATSWRKVRRAGELRFTGLPLGDDLQRADLHDRDLSVDHGRHPDTVGITPQPERPPRAGDYQFNGIGICSFSCCARPCPMTTERRKSYYPVGGCGGNIAWHTEDDVLEIADKDNLLRDMRVYGASVLRTLNAPVHPVDWRLTSAEIGETLDRYAAAAEGVFDFAPARQSLAKLDTASGCALCPRGAIRSE